MKILIHTDEYDPTCAACAYRMKAMADAFTELGDEVTVITSSANGRREEGQTGSERVLLSPAIRMKKKTTLMRMLNNLSFAASSVLTALRAGKADVVITTSPPPLISLSGWLIARMKGARLVYDVRDIWPEVALEMGSFSEESLFCRVFRWIARFMYRRADRITTVSPGKVEKLRQMLPPELWDKVLLVENGFDETILTQSIDQPLADSYGLGQGFTCVYVGNVGLAQGLEAMLELAARTRHRDARFLIFGVGAQRQALEQQAAREGLDNVRFCDVLPHEKVRTVLTRAQLSFISLKNANMKDSIPTKLYEALGLGCPVLLVAEGDACRVMEEAGLGRWVSPGQPERLTQVFDELVEHYDQLTEKRAFASSLIRQRYSRSRASRRLENELKEMLESKWIRK